MRNPAKENHLNHSSLTLDGIISPSPILHPYPFKILFSQTLSIGFRIISRQWFMSTLHQVPQTQTQTKTLLLKVFTPVDLINSFLVISQPINYTTLNYHAKVCYM